MQLDRRKPQQFWTVQERATAMQLAKKGATAAAIGAAIGRTRNSVIGWLHRAGLKLKGAPPPKPPAPLPKREPLPPLGNLITATATQCRWIDTAPAICGRDS